MYTRHDEIPVLYSWQGRIEANHFNRVKRALKRMGPSIRLNIPGLKTLDLILQDDAWIIVDRAYNDIPVAAWSHFETAERENIHLPIECQIRLYHGHASIILKRTLEAMEQLLNSELQDGRHASQVVDFPDKK